ncbi:MAG: hypothetical protein R3A13_04260 [Bdellovibrionota bacterium]
MRLSLKILCIFLLVTYLSCNKKDKVTKALPTPSPTASITPTPSPTATPVSKGVGIDDEDDSPPADLAKALNELSQPEEEPEDDDEVGINAAEDEAESDQAAELETVGDVDEDDLVENQASDQPLFTENEIKELNDSTQNSSLIGGVVNRKTNTDSSSSTFTPESIDTSSQNEDEDEDENADDLGSDLPYVDGQARGYVILNLMQLNARESVRMQLSTMYHARVKHLFLAVLIDGTFGWDFTWFASVIRELNADGRHLTLALYLSNGPTMRQFDSTPIRTTFSRMSPDEFRSRIRFDPTVRSQYVGLAKRAQQIFNLNKQANPANTNLAVVQLEDNLDDDSYIAARDLAQQALADDVLIVRNPCLGCWDGNDADGHGDPREFHNPGELALFGGIGFTLDGTGFHHNFESGSSPNIDSVRGLMDQSMQRGVRYFGLWRKDRQGLQSGTGVHPDQRIYAVPSRQQIDAEIELLRHSLKEVQ